MVWNVWLTVRVYKYTTVGSDNRTVIQNTVDGYQTDITKAVDSAKVSFVMITQASHKNSGVIVAVEKDTAYVMTSAQGLIAANPVDVQFENTLTASGSIVGIDLETNLALIKVQTNFTMTAIELGDSTLINPGEVVIAMGGRRASGSAMISSGAISGTLQIPMIADSQWICNVLEADVTISDVNIGGALLNLSGELIGILVPKPTNGQTGMGYAVAMNEVRSVYAELKNNGSVIRGNFGVVGRSVSKMTSYEKNAASIALDLTSGVVVTSLQKDSAAEKVLQEGDLITAMDGKTVMSEDDMHAMLYAHAAGDAIMLTITRDGSSQQVGVTLR